MKTLFLLFIVFILAFASKAQLVVSSEGYIHFNQGTGTLMEATSTYDPIYRSNKHCSGYLGTSTIWWHKVYSQYLYANGVAVTSDERIKTNIRPIVGAMNILMQLNGKKYDYNLDLLTGKNSADINEKDRSANKDKFGFIAQQVKEILPSIVGYEEDADLYTMDYINLIPIIVEALKEQQATIEKLEKEIEKPDSKNNLKSSSKVTSLEVSETETKAELYQNTPNPFSENTTIKIYLPDATIDAVLYIYDMTGTQIKSYPVKERGNTTVTINGSELNAGMYIYTLIADGKEVDTKRMILTK